MISNILANAFAVRRRLVPGVLILRFKRTDYQFDLAERYLPTYAWQELHILKQLYIRAPFHKATAPRLISYLSAIAISYHPVSRLC